MVKGTTKTGFSFKVDEKRINDAEFLEIFANLSDSENGLEYFKAINMLFDAKQKKALYEHVRTKGMVPIDKLTEEVADVLEAMTNAGETKN